MLRAQPWSLPQACNPYDYRHPCRDSKSFRAALNAPSVTSPHRAPHLDSKPPNPDSHPQPPSMPKIVRLTLFKIPDQTHINQAIQKYATLTQDAVKVRA